MKWEPDPNEWYRKRLAEWMIENGFPAGDGEWVYSHEDMLKELSSQVKQIRKTLQAYQANEMGSGQSDR